MYKHLLILFIIYSICFITESISSIHSHDNLNNKSKIRSRFRRREFVQEEVRKTMLNYMTSIKGEITDIVLDEMIDYYNRQTLKLYNLEKELGSIKNSSLPFINKTKTFNDFILHLSNEQNSFASNMSFIEKKINNLTDVINDLLRDLQQDRTVQHVRRVISPKKEMINDDIPTDCDEVLRQQTLPKDTGIFRIKPRFASDSFDVKCLFEDNIGWTIIQQRVNGMIDFFRKWNDYKNGFGDLKTEFWLGNEKIHQLTRQDEYILRIDLKPWDTNIQIAEYNKFMLDNENENYRLFISEFNPNTSTAGDSLSGTWDNANGTSFSTYDHDYDKLFYDNCALIYHGAWWFNNCFQSHLNGAYIRTPLALHNTARNGLHWNTYSLYHSMKETMMRIRRKTPYRNI